MMIDFQKVVVNKPWGYEYLMYENGTVGIWYLFIQHGARTSLHCHPRTKTGLILLSGEAVISFLNGSTPMKALSKLMIREGFFHSTAAISPEGVFAIETETPCDKTNLIRLDDEYGREEKPYEGLEALAAITEDCVRLNHPEKGKQLRYIMHGCVLSMEIVEGIAGLRHRPPGEIVVILDGGLFSRDGEPVVRSGDVVSADTLGRLAESFCAPVGASLLTIRKEA